MARGWRGTIKLCHHRPHVPAMVEFCAVRALPLRVRVRAALVTGSCGVRETNQAGCPWARPRVSLCLPLSGLPPPAFGWRSPTRPGCRCRRRHRASPAAPEAGDSAAAAAQADPARPAALPVQLGWAARPAGLQRGCRHGRTAAASAESRRGHGRPAATAEACRGRAASASTRRGSSRRGRPVWLPGELN